MQALIAWILATALHFAPPSKHKHFDGHEETAAQVRARYEQIATDIAVAVQGQPDEHAMAALALAWAIGESGLHHDTDVGPCYREGAWKRRCDSGRAAGLWQLHEHLDRETGERVTVAAIFADRAGSARFVVRALRGSWAQCSHLAAEDRYSGFGLGHCEAGNASVRERYRLWLRVRAWRPKAGAASSGTMSNEPDTNDETLSKASNAIVHLVSFYAKVAAVYEAAAARAREEAHQTRIVRVQLETALAQRDRELASAKLAEVEAAVPLEGIPLKGKFFMVRHSEADSHGRGQVVRTLVWVLEVGGERRWVCDSEAPKWVHSMCDYIVQRSTGMVHVALYRPARHLTDDGEPERLTRAAARNERLAGDAVALGRLVLDAYEIDSTSAASSEE